MPIILREWLLKMWYIQAHCAYIDKQADMKKVKKGSWPTKVLKSTNENDLLKITNAQ